MGKKNAQKTKKFNENSLFAGIDWEAIEADAKVFEKYGIMYQDAARLIVKQFADELFARLRKSA